MADEKENQNNAGSEVSGRVDYLAAIDSFLKQSDVEIALTYDDQPTIKFPCRFLMSEDANAIRQTFYSMPDESRESARHKYHVDLLASVLSGPVDGLPYFVELCNDNPDASPGDVLKSYLMRGGDRAIKIAEDAIAQYNKKTQPIELFR